jgi:pimeloyl-ACP methyl ester carboxylesterase
VLDREPPTQYGGGVPHAVRSDVRVHYDVAGHGFPLLMVAGAGAEGSAWERAGYLTRLADRFRCVAIDPRGFGGSDRPSAEAAYGLDEHARDVLAVADAVGAPRFAYWGHSAGGLIGLALAAMAPDRVAAAVVASAWVGTDPASARNLCEGLAAAVRARGWRGLITPLLEDEGFGAEHWLADLTPDIEALAQYYVRLPDAAAIDLEAIRSPILLLVGGDEDPEHTAAATANRIAGAEIEWLPGRAHLGAFLDAAGSIARGRPFLERAIGAQPR